MRNAVYENGAYATHVIHVRSWPEALCCLLTRTALPGYNGLNRNRGVFIMHGSIHLYLLPGPLLFFFAASMQRSGPTQDACT